jgi:hypothetical protein
VGGLDFPGELPSDELELAGARDRRSPVPLSLTVGARLAGATRGRDGRAGRARAVGRVFFGPAQ